MAANDKIVIADTKNNVIRMVDAITGTITTIADQQAPCRESSPPSPCQLNEPAGLFIVSSASAADGALRVSNTLGQTITTAGIDPTGTHTTNIRPSVSCGNVPGVSGIDWLLPIVLLGVIAGRRRIGMFFTRLWKPSAIVALQ